MPSFPHSNLIGALRGETLELNSYTAGRWLGDHR